MGRERVSGTPRRNNRVGKKTKRSPGLELVERDGYWHIQGTVRAGGRSIRVRRTTGLPATTENREAAEHTKSQVETRIRNEAIFGITPTENVAVAAREFLNRPRKRPLNARDVAIVKAVGKHFAVRDLGEITDKEWGDFIELKTAGRSLQNRERWITGICAFLNWCRKKPRRWIKELPEFERDETIRNPRHRRARRVHDLTDDIVLMMIEHAAPHLKGQLVAERESGARVSSVIFGCRLCDLIAVHGRGQITFHDTKNGEPVVASLSDWAVDQLLEYLKWRGRLEKREEPLFLTDERLPYIDNRHKGRSGFNKSAFNGMRRRTVRALRRQAATEALALRRQGQVEEGRSIYRAISDRANLVAQVTQHWFRHALATRVRDLRMAMEQGGWLDVQSVMAYQHDVPTTRRALIEELAPKVDDLSRDASLTRETLPRKNNGRGAKS